MLSKLEPKKVFYYFEKLTTIPRCSGHEGKVADFVEEFAKKRNLECIRDEYNNIIIKKDATKGHENSPTTILQGHLDMVCVKTKEHTHDFSSDPLKLYIDGDFVMAKNTSLGADNGVAIAMCLAILDSDDIAHPNLEVVMTTDEEVGMTGAIKLDKSNLSAKYFLNLDSEEEGEFTLGCAGGNRSTIEVPYKLEKGNDFTTLKVIAGKFKGGHSGMEIDKNRANASVVMGRILEFISRHVSVNLIKINGGTKDNVITNNCEAIINVKNKDVAKVKEIVDFFVKTLRNEFIDEDQNATLAIEEIKPIEKQMDDETTRKVIFVLFNAPNGVQSMSSELKGMVESSLNLGVLSTDEEKVSLNFAVRGNVKSKKQYIVAKLGNLAKMVGANFRVRSDYPEWAFQKNSKLLRIVKKVYKETTGKRAKIKAIHAGLECGVFLHGMTDMEAVSFGPNMYDVHSVDERLSISSTKRTYEYLLKLLEKL